MKFTLDVILISENQTLKGEIKKMTTIKKNLERQHQDIYNIINETKSMINGADLEGNSANIARNISVLAGKLKIHLSNEDKYLYPSLIKKRDTSLQNKTKHYIDEMGNLSQTYMTFKDKYNTRSKIMSDSKTFKQDANKVFEAVLQRMHREDTDLYVLAKVHVQ